jgi:hypothetical protein
MICADYRHLAKIGNRSAASTLNERIQRRPICKGTIVMPALLWVVFWSSLMGGAACFGADLKPVPVKAPKKRD